jgi:hypothetical protein
MATDAFINHRASGGSHLTDSDSPHSEFKMKLEVAAAVLFELKELMPPVHRFLFNFLLITIKITYDANEIYFKVLPLDGGKVFNVVRVC